MNEVELLEKLAAAVIAYDEQGAVALASRGIQEGADPLNMVEQGLAAGLKIVGDRFGSGDLFLPELMISARTFKAAMDVISPSISARAMDERRKGTVLIGTVEGDIHDLGKTIVAGLAAAYGFQVVDLGVNVKVATFTAKVAELKPDIVGMSALLTSTRLKQQETIRALERVGLRDRVKVIIGGAVATESWAREIGADAFGANAADGVNKMLALVGG